MGDFSHLERGGEGLCLRGLGLLHHFYMLAYELKTIVVVGKIKKAMGDITVRLIHELADYTFFYECPGNFIAKEKVFT